MEMNLEGCCSVIERLPSMLEALRSRPGTALSLTLTHMLHTLE